VDNANRLMEGSGNEGRAKSLLSLPIMMRAYEESGTDFLKADISPLAPPALVAEIKEILVAISWC